MTLSPPTPARPLAHPPAHPAARTGTLLDRRALLRTAAWTVPVIAMAAPAPAFAVSPCTAAPFPTNWVVADPASGTLSSATDNGYAMYGSGGVTRYLSIADNSKTSVESNAANDATITVQTTLTLVVGRPYTFTFTVASGFSGNQLAGSQLQKLDIQFNGASVGRYTTNVSTTTPALTTGYTVLNTTNGSITTQTIALSYTPTTTSVVLRYLYTLPARGYNPVLGLPTGTYTGSSDIAVSAPDIGGC